jgi:hypothetical protein
MPYGVAQGSRLHIAFVLPQAVFGVQFGRRLVQSGWGEMRLAAVTTVRNECDIVESFVRHNAVFFDHLYILDHRSIDNTSDILCGLVAEGLPLTVSRDDEGIFYQSLKMNRLIRQALWDHPWDFIIPLDCDEFLCAPDRAALERALAALDDGTIGVCSIVNYIPTVHDDGNEIDVLRRIVHRAQTVPEISCKIGKVVIPGAICKQEGFSLNEGHHGVRIDGWPVAEHQIEGLSLAHFPIRSPEQFTLRAVISRLAWSARSDYDPGWGWHYRAFCEQLKGKPAVSVADLTEAALLYVDIYLQPGSTPHRKVLVRDPVVPAYARLRFAELVAPKVLPPILDMAEFLLAELRETRPSSKQVTAGTVAGSSREADRPAEHRFQSFWHGGALSPYELLCLKSFIDCGHAVDLYSYDANLVVPPGVRLCNANELVPRDKASVYQADGFGKGSPAALANLFRYTLLAEKGGWWIDTDVICLTGRIPTVSTFFARQDADFVNNAILYFEARHPVMVQCRDQAKQLGRTVKGGDTGPRLLTRVLEEHGLIGQALPATLCYPVHYSEALDLLRPAKLPMLADRIEPSLFLHLWHAMLAFHGVQKSCLPPKGSLLRDFADKHAVVGWVGEYDERTLEQVVNLKAELHSHNDERNRLQANLEAMRTSASWRLTAPLRAGIRRAASFEFFRRRR